MSTLSAEDGIGLTKAVSCSYLVQSISCCEWSVSFVHVASMSLFI